jgi:hypothetical protein
MHTLDHITNACLAALRDGDSEITNYFHRAMDAAAQIKFDGHLVQINHPLAYEAGAPESRFRRYVGRMVELERTRRIMGA